MNALYAILGIIAISVVIEGLYRFCSWIYDRGYEAGYNSAFVEGDDDDGDEGDEDDYDWKPRAEIIEDSEKIQIN